MNITKVDFDLVKKSVDELNATLQKQIILEKFNEHFQQKFGGDLITQDRISEKNESIESSQSSCAKAIQEKEKEPPCIAIH